MRSIHPPDANKLNFYKKVVLMVTLLECQHNTPVVNCAATRLATSKRSATRNGKTPFLVIRWFLQVVRFLVLF